MKALAAATRRLRAARGVTVGGTEAELARARDAERRRLARDLHDEAGQSLTALAVGLQALQALERPEDMRAHAGQLHEIALETLDTISRLASGLRQRSRELGVRAAIERHLRDWPQRDIAVRFATEGFDEAVLRAEVNEALYWILLESLTNVQRHSRARHVAVVLRQMGSLVEAVVSDDGKGFDVDAVLEGVPREALGLRAMEERATEVGGAVDIDSHPRRGTRVEIRLPAG